ncbi:hypothetical protein [Paludisphaera soli]|uniref:hypothetical protein n=1 Tax=Paludisphaera soli TaxID=2712865 RepID=UPI0013ECA224|nr:hypothetical protein [Paludisphaera soli]
MSKSRKRRPTPTDRSQLIRRILYFAVMVATGGGAGVGGWLCKDYPQLQPIIALFLGEAGADGEAASLKDSFKSAVAGALTESSSRPGVYQVRIDAVQLDPKSFTPGRTVDIQAQVRRIDAEGAESVVWESRTFGENFAVVGRDELSAHWSNRPFEIEWRRGDRFLVEVWGRRAGLFSAQSFRMARRDVDSFPLGSGEFALEPEGRVRPGTDPSRNRIVLASRRTGDAARRPDQPPRDDVVGPAPAAAPARRGPDLPARLAEGPIIIR